MLYHLSNSIVQLILMIDAGDSFFVNAVLKTAFISSVHWNIYTFLKQSVLNTSFTNDESLSSNVKNFWTDFVIDDVNKCYIIHCKIVYIWWCWFIFCKWCIWNRLHQKHIYEMFQRTCFNVHVSSLPCKYLCDNKQQRCETNNQPFVSPTQGWVFFFVQFVCIIII